MTRNEKKFLSRRICSWCDQSLDKDWCAAIFEKCPDETRIKRREDCLKTYRPRNAPNPVSPSREGR